MSLRIAVIGVGHLGKHHARILSRCPASSSSRWWTRIWAGPTEIASEYRHDGRSTDPRELTGKVDAVTIAVPTEIHRDIALPFLSAGVPVLVEKPMAQEPRRSRRHDRGGGEGGRHCSPSATPSDSIPRWPSRANTLTDPRFIEVHRLGVFPERSLDIDVVFDVMIHDLDVILSLVEIRGRRRSTRSACRC